MGLFRGKFDRLTILDVDVFISPADSKTAYNVAPPIPIYQNGKKYPCTHKSITDINCGRFIDGAVMTVQGKYVKTQVPSGGVGSSAGQYQATKYTDFYYLEVD